jgi:hypothetical protein
VVNKPHVFKDRDVQRVIKAARSAGLAPTGVEVNLETRTIKVTGDASGKPLADDAEAAWDAAVEKLSKK